MACLSTSGRVACGARRQQTHNFIWRVMLNHNLRRQSSSNCHPIQTVPMTTQGHSLHEPARTQNLARSYHGLSFGRDQLGLVVSKSKSELWCGVWCVGCGVWCVTCGVLVVNLLSRHLTRVHCALRSCAECLPLMRLRDFGFCCRCLCLVRF